MVSESCLRRTCSTPRITLRILESVILDDTNTSALRLDTFRISTLRIKMQAGSFVLKLEMLDPASGRKIPAI